MLFAALERVEKEGVELLILHETERLFRKLPLDGRDRMLRSLEPYNAVIFDARRNRLLSQFDEGRWINVASASPLASAVG